MAYGKNGATCWQAGAERTLQKRVEWVEAKDSFKNVIDWRGEIDKHAVIKLHTEYHVPAPEASYAVSAPVVEYIVPSASSSSPVPVVEYIAPATSYVTPASVVDYIAPAPAVYAASGPVAEYITPAPMKFVEAVLHEIDEELCIDDIEELCYVVRMSQKRIWRRVWHSCSSPSGASKSERTWRALSARLCYE